VEIRELGSQRWMHFGGEAIQSLIDLDHPELPVLAYTRAMLASLLFNPNPSRLLNLGVGGGSFERFFHTKMPHLELTSVESNPVVIDLVRRFFQFPTEPKVIIDHADHFLSTQHECFDIVLCDLFDRASHPPCLRDSNFYQHALQSLTDEGVLALNLLPANQPELLNILLAVRRSFDWVRVLDIPDHRNILLFCLRQQGPNTEILEARAQNLKQQWGVDLTEIPQRLQRLPKPSPAVSGKRSGGASPSQ
jgi:spermidine synthase